MGQARPWKALALKELYEGWLMACLVLGAPGVLYVLWRLVPSDAFWSEPLRQPRVLAFRVLPIMWGIRAASKERLWGRTLQGHIPVRPHTRWVAGFVGPVAVSALAGALFELTMDPKLPGDLALTGALLTAAAFGIAYLFALTLSRWVGLVAALVFALGGFRLLLPCPDTQNPFLLHTSIATAGIVLGSLTLGLLPVRRTVNGLAALAIPAVIFAAVSWHGAAALRTDWFVRTELTGTARLSPAKPVLAALTHAGDVEILSLQGRVLKVLHAPAQKLVSLAYSPDGRHLMAGARSGAVLVWDLETGAYRTALKPRAREAFRVEWFPDQRRGVVGLERVDGPGESGADNCLVFSVSNGREVGHIQAYCHGQGFAVSHDGERLAVLQPEGRARGAYVLSLGHGKPAMLFDKDYPSGPLSVAMSPDNRTVAVGYAPYHLALWDARRGRLTKLIKGHENWVVSLAFSPDGSMLASGGGDGRACIWSVPDGRELRRICFGMNNYVRSVGFSPDGRLLVAVAEDGTVSVARVPAVGKH